MNRTMGTWLEATWADVQAGTRIRRDIGEVGEVFHVRRQVPGETGPGQLYVEVSFDDGDLRTLAVWSTNFVWVEVETL